MLHDAPTFSGFSVDNIDAAKDFYDSILGLSVEQSPMGLNIHCSGGDVFVYAKEDHKPATFTVLNFEVSDIDRTIDQLEEKGVIFERYDNLPAEQDERNVLRGKSAGMGPDIAWFKDPAGNILSILSS